VYFVTVNRACCRVCYRASQLCGRTCLLFM